MRAYVSEYLRVWMRVTWSILTFLIPNNQLTNSVASMAKWQWNSLNYWMRPLSQTLTEKNEGRSIVLIWLFSTQSMLQRTKRLIVEWTDTRIPTIGQRINIASIENTYKEHAELVWAWCGSAYVCACVSVFCAFHGGLVIFYLNLMLYLCYER